MTNAEIARIFREIAVYLDMENVPFRPRAYERAAYAIDALDRPLAEIHAAGGTKALTAIPGIGAHTAERIAELVTTGHLEYYDALKKKMPVDITSLTSIEGLGPKNVKVLYETLGIKTVSDLERAARAHEIRTLRRFGPKSEEKILRGIAFLRASARRFPLGTVLPFAEEVRARIATVPGVTAALIAGSIRRRCDTVGDADILAIRSGDSHTVDYDVVTGGLDSSIELRAGVQRDTGDDVSGDLDISAGRTLVAEHIALGAGDGEPNFGSVSGRVQLSDVQFRRAASMNSALFWNAYM